MKKVTYSQAAIRLVCVAVALSGLLNLIAADICQLLIVAFSTVLLLLSAVEEKYKGHPQRYLLLLIIVTAAFACFLYMLVHTLSS